MKKPRCRKSASHDKENKMLVPISWLKEYVDIDIPVDEFADAMIMSGSNIETVKTFGEGITNVVIGKMISVEKHEDSDHLLVCKIDVGEASESGEPLQIVTGAQNVAAGQTIPVAMHGSTLAGGLKIKKGKLRGVVSEGMLCSCAELGFDDKVIPQKCKDGIWILPDELKAGDNALEALDLYETVIDFEITPNRPDCLSILGMAREAAAVYEKTLKYPQTLATDDVSAAYPEGKDAEDFIKINIENPELCNRYVARVAEDIEIKESPWWLQRRLMFAGMRPINNIVDITNFVMLELGHPIHAFDIRTIDGGVINVGVAKEGEKFTTLDENERTLFADSLLIKDGSKAVALAGVMGGLNSEIEGNTERILIEAASFDADSIRQTSKKVGIRSEASSRYEKGVASQLSSVASDRVCYLIKDIGAGHVLKGAADNYPVKPEDKSIEVRVDKVNAVLGTSLSADVMTNILERLEMKVENKGDGIILVTPGYVRLDLVTEIDIVEEVARIFGYNNLEVTLHADNISASYSDKWGTRMVARDALTGFGFNEIQTYSFVSPTGIELINAADDSAKNDFVRLLNPLGEENSVMRTTLLPSALEVLSRNYNRKNADCGVFEIGNTFHSLGKDELPKEEFSLCIGMYGANADFFYLKGVVEKMLEKLGVKGVQLEAEKEIATYHPGRCAKIYLADAQSENGKIVLGIIGEIHPDVAEKYDIDTKILSCEINFDTLFEYTDMARSYSPLPKYPAVLRDISLLVSEDISVGSIEETIYKKGGANLESVVLFDVYRGKQIPEGSKSLSFNLIFRAADRTLVDEDVTKALEKILKTLAEETGAALREM